MSWAKSLRRYLAGRLSTFAREQSGNAAVEMAIWVGVLVLPLLNIIDLGLYIFRNIEVENAAQMAVQAVWVECGQMLQPADTKCSGYSTAMTRGVRSTTLGSQVTISSSSVQKYCIDGSGALVQSGCTPNTWYLRVTASYDYTPMFSPISVAALFGSPITRTTYGRML